MIAVIFEVWPKPERRQEYLDIAADLRGHLETIDGFISVERFESLSEPGKLLSLSFWRDEAAVRAWRNFGVHRSAQSLGRAGIFADYRLRVAGVTRGCKRPLLDQLLPESQTWFSAAFSSWRGLRSGRRYADTCRALDCFASTGARIHEIAHDSLFPWPGRPVAEQVVIDHVRLHAFRSCMASRQAW